MRENLEKKLSYTPPSAKYLNLATNENFEIEAKEILKLNLEELMANSMLNQYGQSEHPDLLENYAKYLNIQTANILPAPGSESLITVLLQAFVKTALLTFDTDFFRYGEVATILEKKHITTPITAGIDGLISAQKSEKIDLIMLSNPNNPLGFAHSKVDLIRLLDETECYVVVDEAYGEYYGESMVDLLTSYPKLIILRTMSKGWGLAALRVGFMIASSELVSYVKAVQGPFVLSDLNANVAAKVLENEEGMRMAVNKTKKVRSEFIKFLKKFDVDVLPSETNFVYFKTSLASDIVAKLFAEKIVVVGRSDGIRVTIGNEQQMNILMAKLVKLLPLKTD